MQHVDGVLPHILTLFAMMAVAGPAAAIPLKGIPPEVDKDSEHVFEPVRAAAARQARNEEVPLGSLSLAQGHAATSPPAPAPTPVPSPDLVVSQHGSDLLGLEVRTFIPDLASQLGMRTHQGVVVVTVQNGSPAERVGFRSGDVILEVNGELTRNVDEFERAVRSITKGNRVLIMVRRGERLQYVALEP
jgi:hypothetical protein